MAEQTGTTVGDSTPVEPPQKTTAKVSATPVQPQPVVTESQEPEVEGTLVRTRPGYSFQSVKYPDVLVTREGVRVPDEQVEDLVRESEGLVRVVDESPKEG